MQQANCSMLRRLLHPLFALGRKTAVVDSGSGDSLEHPHAVGEIFRLGELAGSGPSAVVGQTKRRLRSVCPAAFLR